MFSIMIDALIRGFLRILRSISSPDVEDKIYDYHRECDAPDDATGRSCH
jgi:hypothetical protein